MEKISSQSRCWWMVSRTRKISVSAKVVRINPEHIKECSIPDALQKIEQSDASFVIHVKDGKWTFQSIKGEDKTLFNVIGMLRCISLKLEQMANQ